MPTNQVTVRFVPRGRNSVSLEMMAQAPSDSLAGAVDPTSANARNAWRGLVSHGVSADQTPLNRVTATMSEKEFHSMFAGTTLKRVPLSSERSMSASDEIVSPDNMDLPEALRDDFLFAYIPRPVEYFAPLAIPPREDIYHLRLSDVAMALNTPRCHRAGWNGEGVTVAMADSGFWMHPYFIRSGYGLVPTESPGSGDATEDTSGHGTGESANIFAVAPRCKVFGVKLGSSSAGTLERCIDLKPDVMTNSWGFNIDSQSRDELRDSDPSMFNELIDLENVLQIALDRKIVVLFSAGNGQRAFPSSFPGVISVGGVTVNEDGSLEASNYASSFRSALYANRNCPDVCGLTGRREDMPQSAHIALPVPPDSKLDGENFPSGTKKTGWGIFSGTSAACPQVAGVAALLKQIDSSLTSAQVRQVLAARTVDIVKGKTALGDKAKLGPDRATGAGLVDALRSCGHIVGIA